MIRIKRKKIKSKKHLRRINSALRKRIKNLKEQNNKLTTANEILKKENERNPSSSNPTTTDSTSVYSKILDVSYDKRERDKALSEFAKKKKCTLDKYTHWPELLCEEKLDGQRNKNYIPFKAKRRCIGNGEDRLVMILKDNDKKEKDLGGQNSTVDISKIPFLKWKEGNGSVKDQTTDSCIVGTDCTKLARKIFAMTVYLFVSWVLKWKDKECEIAEEYYNQLDYNYGSAKLKLLDGIYKFELASGVGGDDGNYPKLSSLLEDLKKKFNNDKEKHDSLKSEYVEDIVNAMGEKTLKELMDDCVRTEAINNNLFIVHKTEGWLLVRDIEKITCPRITRGAPRIDYEGARPSPRPRSAPTRKS